MVVAVPWLFFSVQIHREEIFRQISGENAAAVASADAARDILRSR